MELMYTISVEAEWEDGTTGDVVYSQLILGPWTGKVLDKAEFWLWTVRLDFYPMARGTADSMDAAKAAAEAAIREHAQEK